MIVRVSAPLLPKIWNMVMLKSYDAKTNGRVCDARAVAHLTGHWHRNHCPLSPLRVPNQCGEQLLAGEVRPSSDETFLFITLTEREKVVSPVTSPLSDSLLGLPGCSSGVRCYGTCYSWFFPPRPWIPSHPVLHLWQLKTCFQCLSAHNWTATLFHS